MALPANLTMKTVTGTFLYSNGAPLVGGLVSFRPKINPNNLIWLQDPTAATPTIIVINPRVLTLDVNGQFSTSLPASDDADLIPRGWSYEVVVSLSTAGIYRSAMLPLLAAGPASVDISAVLPA